MRVRTLVSLLFVFLFVWLVISTIAMNQQEAVIRLPLVPPLALELGFVLLGAFLAGALVILVFDLVGGARRFARDLKARRRHREHAKTEDLYVHGLDDLANGRLEQALARFEEVLSREPDHLNALTKKGEVLRQLGRYAEAAVVLEAAARLVPDNLVVLYALSDVFVDMGDEGRAEATLRRIIDVDPETTVSAHRKLRDLKMRQGDWRGADELQQRIESMVTLADEKEKARATAIGLRYELGRDHLAKERFDEAIAAFESVLARDAAFVPAYLELGAARLAQGDTEAALETWRKGYQATGSTELLSAIQNYHLQVDEPEEAIAVWKQAIVLSENEAPLRYCLGKLYYRLFMLDEALKEFRLIEDNVSGLPSLHVYIARILEAKGDLQGALAKTKMVLGEVAGLMMDYSCAVCQKVFAEWKERCDHCGRWNSIVLDVRAAAVPEPTIRPAPTWSTP